MKPDLSKINLNLLVALEALLVERHVTKAGKRLHISQSAMSNNLKQLRDLFKDELFIRGQASKIEPTAFLLSIEKDLIFLLDNTRHLLESNKPFDASLAVATITFGLSDYIEAVLLPHLIKEIHQRAPNITINIKHINYIKNKEQFDLDSIDIAIGVFNRLPNTLIGQTIFDDKVVCIASKNNCKIKHSINQQQLAKLNRVAIQFFEYQEELLTEKRLLELQEGNHVNAARIIYPHALAAPFLIQDSDYVAITLEKMARILTQHFRLRYVPLTFFKENYQIQMVWNEKYRNQPIHKWIRQLIKSTSATL